jgi:hypothetical protein
VPGSSLSGALNAIGLSPPAGKPLAIAAVGLMNEVVTF